LKKRYETFLSLTIEVSTVFNVTNILRAAFFVQRCFVHFVLGLQFGFVIFYRLEIGAKLAYKILVTLATSVNFINILRATF